MFKSENVGHESAGFQHYTGLVSCKLLAINPTAEKLGEYVKSPDKFDTTYALKEDLYVPGVMVRPVMFIIQDVNEEAGPQIFTVNLAPVKETVGVGGKVRLINAHAVPAVASSVEDLQNNPKMEWYSKTGIHVGRIGEALYYNILDAFLKYNHEKGSNFLDECKENGLDFDTVYSGNFKGLHSFVEFCNNNSFHTLFLYGVREDDGKSRQTVINSLDLCFRASTVQPFHINKIHSLHTSAVSRGSKLSKAYFTADFMLYDKKACLNYEGEYGEEQSIPDIDGDSLPFDAEEKLGW